MNNDKQHITHLTSVHTRYDTRIFLKQCMSLTSNGYTVSLVVADGKANEIKSNIEIFDVGASKGRLDRIKNATSRILKKAIELNSDLYHIHDPELIPIGLKLKKMGKKVVFDAHEDIPKQILTKSYINKPSRTLLSYAFSMYEKLFFNKFDAIIVATPFIRDKYLSMGISSIDINNYPILDELNTGIKGWTHKKNQVCYIGSIDRVRGIQEMVQAMTYLDSETKFILGGNFHSLGFKTEVMAELGWNKVSELGWLDRDKVRMILSESIAGLVTLHPSPRYLDSLPVKMFEYMAAGLPVIASSFPLWKEIIEGNRCGICVDPLSPRSIANAIEYLVDNQDIAIQMGKNGQTAVQKKYNWNNEEAKLLSLYHQLLHSIN